MRFANWFITKTNISLRRKKRNERCQDAKHFFFISFWSRKSSLKKATVSFFSFSFLNKSVPFPCVSQKKNRFDNKHLLRKLRRKPKYLFPLRIFQGKKNTKLYVLLVNLMSLQITSITWYFSFPRKAIFFFLNGFKSRSFRVWLPGENTIKSTFMKFLLFVKREKNKPMKCLKITIRYISSFKWKKFPFVSAIKKDILLHVLLSKTSDPEKKIVIYLDIKVFESS